MRRRRGEVQIPVRLARPELTDRKKIAIIRSTCESAAAGTISGPDALSWIARLVGGRLLAGVAVAVPVRRRRRAKGKN